MINEEIRRILDSERSQQTKLLELQKIGRMVYDALSQPVFEQVMKSLTDLLRGEIAALKEDCIKIENEINEHEALLAEKDKIEKEFDTLRARQEELANLKEKISILNLPENAPSRINEEMAHFEGSKNNLLQKHLETLQKLNIVLYESSHDLEKQLEAKIKDASNNLTAIEQNQIKGLEMLDTAPIKSRFTGFANEINRLVKEHNLYVEKIKGIKDDLEEIAANHDMVTENYKAHNLENETIFGSLESREGVKNYVQLLRKEIDERLLIFDNEIREIVKKREQLPVYELAETKQYQ